MFAEILSDILSNFVPLAALLLICNTTPSLTAPHPHSRKWGWGHCWVLTPFIYRSLGTKPLMCDVTCVCVHKWVTKISQSQILCMSAHSWQINWFCFWGTALPWMVHWGLFQTRVSLNKLPWFREENNRLTAWYKTSKVKMKADQVERTLMCQKH